MNWNKFFNFLSIFWVMFFSAMLVVNLLAGNKGVAIIDLVFIMFNAYQINYRLNLLTDVVEAAQLQKEKTNGQ